MHLPQVAILHETVRDSRCKQEGDCKPGDVVYQLTGVGRKQGISRTQVAGGKENRVKAEYHRRNTQARVRDLTK